LFDVDGVLVNSYPAYHRIWSRWATLRHLDPDVVRSHTHAAGRSTPSRWGQRVRLDYSPEW
jgi:beta-phosphoglucomutase-like phosphatase (HAD superfamily)